MWKILQLTQPTRFQVVHYSKNKELKSEFPQMAVLVFNRIRVQMDDNSHILLEVLS